MTTRRQQVLNETQQQLVRYTAVYELKNHLQFIPQMESRNAVNQKSQTTYKLKAVISRKTTTVINTNTDNSYNSTFLYTHTHTYTLLPYIMHQ